MADNNTSDQSEKGNDTGVHPPASEELPSGGPFLEGQNQDDLSTYSNETTLTDNILNVPAIGSDKTDTEANALTAHSDANKVSNSKSKFHESLPGNNSGAVTPENSSKLQERRQDLQSGGEHSDTRCKNETLFHDSIQSSDTTVIPDDRREMDDHDSKRSPDIAGTPGYSHKGEDEDLTGSPDVAGTPGDSHKGEDEDLTGSPDIAGTPGESHEGEVEDLTGSSDIAGTSGDSHKGDNDLTRSPGITELSEYSDHILPDSPTTQFSPERAGANQTPASPSTSVVDNPGSPVVMSTPDNKFRNSPHYESESGISQGESGIWSSQSEFGTGYNDTESGVGHSPSESVQGHSPSESGVEHSPSESGLGHSPSESGIEMSFNDQRNKRVKKTIFLEERIRELEAKIHAKEEEKKLQEDKRVKETIFLKERIKELETKIHAQEEEKKLQGNHAEELENFLQEKAGLLKEIDDLQDVEVKNWGLQKDIQERDSHIKRLQDKIEDLKDVKPEFFQSDNHDTDHRDWCIEAECKSFKQKLEESLANQKDLEQQIQNLQKKHAKDVESLQKELYDSKQRAVELQKKIVYLQVKEKEFNELKNKHDECEKSLQNLKKEKARLQGNHAEELENLLQEKAGLLKKIDDLQDEEVKNWELQKDIEERDSHIKRLQDKIEDLKGVEGECKSFKQKWEESLANQKDLEQRIQNLQIVEVEGKSFKQKWEESLANQKDLEQRIKYLQSVEVECKSFKQKLEESLANQKDLEQRIQNLQSVEGECKSFKQKWEESLANQKDLEQRIQNLQKEVTQSLDLKQQTDEKEKQLRNLQDQIKKLKDEHAQELNTLKKQFDEAKEKINEEMTRSSSEKHAKDVESLQKELNDTKQKAVKLQQKIVYLQAKEKEFNELKNKHDECEKSLQNLARLQDDHVTKTNELRENLMKQHQEELQHLQGTKAQCEEELASNKLILNNALLRELREKEEKDKCQHIIEEKRAEEVKILQERDRLEAELQSCRTKAKSSRTRCLLWKCVTYLRTLQLKNLENVYEGIVSEFEEQKRLNTTMQRALAESQEELDELNSKLQDERDAVSELQQDKATLEEKNAVLQDSLQQTKDQVSDRHQQIEKLKAQRKQLEKLKAKSDEQVMQAQVVNNTLQMQMVKLQHERVRENTLNESKISELTAQIRQREQQFLPLEMQVQQTMQELGSAHSRLEEVQDCNRTLKEELHKATAALTERGRQEEALQSKIQDLSLKNSRYLHELFTVRRDLSVVTEKLRRTEVWMR